VDRDTKRNNDGRTEKNGAGYVVRSGTSRLSGTWDEWSQWPPIPDIRNFKKITIIYSILFYFISIIKMYLNAKKLHFSFRTPILLTGVATLLLISPPTPLVVRETGQRWKISAYRKRIGEDLVERGKVWALIQGRILTNRDSLVTNDSLWW
jgi:hypothetical protein